MITLKEARKQVIPSIEKPPTLSTLGKWASKGVISNPVEYDNRGKQGGRVGLYPEELTTEILVACALSREKDWRLEEIAEIREQVIKDIRRTDDINKLIAKKSAERGKIEDVIVDLIENETTGKIEDLFEEADFISKQRSYLQAWKTYSRNHNKKAAL